jgi:cytochrome P450
MAWIFPEGAKVQMLFGAANHDPAVFNNPDEFRLDRRSIRGATPSCVRCRSSFLFGGIAGATRSSPRAPRDTGHAHQPACRRSK